LLRSQNLNLEDTIFALISGALPSAVAVFRLSGPKSFFIAQSIFKGAQGKTLEKERGMVYGDIHDLQNQFLDSVLLLSFVAPNSFTGQDCIEIHCHGAKPIAEKLEKTFLELGARPAERGEFSYRAFQNDKFNLADLENLADVFIAKDGEDLKSIYQRKSSHLKSKIETLRASLLHIQAILDTAVDFSDEYSNVVAHAYPVVTQAHKEITELLGLYQRFVGVRTQPKIVLVGKPNAGKSSLFNTLLGKYRAIVHSQAGTTRDAVEDDVIFAGKNYKLVDTAGLRAAASPTEEEGIEFSKNYLSAASLCLFVIDGTDPYSMDPEILSSLENKPHILIWNKCDDPRYQPPQNLIKAVKMSCISGEGLQDLEKEIEKELNKNSIPSHLPLPTFAEFSQLKNVTDSFEPLLKAFDEKLPPEYLAEENRMVLNQLDKVIGQVDIEQVLDRVFSEFCIGK